MFPTGGICLYPRCSVCILNTLDGCLREQFYSPTWKRAAETDDWKYSFLDWRTFSRCCAKERKQFVIGTFERKFDQKFDDMRSNMKSFETQFWKRLEVRMVSSDSNCSLADLISKGVTRGVNRMREGAENCFDIAPFIMFGKYYIDALYQVISIITEIVKTASPYVDPQQLHYEFISISQHVEAAIAIFFSGRLQQQLRDRKSGLTPESLMWALVLEVVNNRPLLNPLWKLVYKKIVIDTTSNWDSFCADLGYNNDLADKTMGKMLEVDYGLLSCPLPAKSKPETMQAYYCKNCYRPLKDIDAYEAHACTVAVDMRAPHPLHLTKLSRTLYVERIEKLSEGQQNAAALLQTSPYPLLWLTGEAGAGKTHMMLNLLMYMQAHGGIGSAVYISSVKLVQVRIDDISGFTFHSFFHIDPTRKIPSPLDYLNSLTPVQKTKFRILEVLFYDESASVTVRDIDWMNAFFCLLNPNYYNIPFGGVKVILCADLSQRLFPPKDKNLGFEHSSFFQEHVKIGG